MKKNIFMKMLTSLVSLFFLGCFIAIALALFVVVHFTQQLPDYRQLDVYDPLITTRFYASDGQLLAEYASEKRVFVPITAIPKQVLNAFIAAEDKNFYSHNGIDYLGIVRAIVSNIKNYGKGRRMIGASTITQQVAKNFLLTNEMSITRKIKEALLARRIEERFDKDYILELYMNQIYLGFHSYGIAAASLMYFDKSLDELTLSETAFLAGLPKGPNNYNPNRNYDAAVARRNYVLNRMLEDGYITPAEAKTAMEEPIVVKKKALNDTIKNASYYNEEIRRVIEKQYGTKALYQGGLSVRTSLDPDLQNIAVDVLEKGLDDYDKRHGYRGAVSVIDLTPDENGQVADYREKLSKITKPAYLPETWQVSLVLSADDDKAQIETQDGKIGYILLSDLSWAKKALEDGKVSTALVKKTSDVFSVGDVVYAEKKDGTEDVFVLRQFPQVEGALVALDPHTGRVLAMVGGLSFERSQFNRAVQAYRQPGSSFKPFVYLTALDSGFTPSTLILDAPLVVDQGNGQDKWKPRNYTKIFYGPTTLRTGIEKSRNLMTVRLAQAVGIEKTVEYAKKFGIVDDMAPVLSMSLGSGETTLMRLTSAYAMLVNGGKKITPTLIDRIQDRTGKTIYKYDKRLCPNCQGLNASNTTVPQVPDTREQIQDPISAYQMVHIMTGVVERGTGKVAQTVKKTLAGKSGTSNDNFDTWFIGFSPDLVVGVFVGFDEPKTLGPKDTGGVVATPIFRDFMLRALKDKQDTPFRVPEGVRLMRVNYKTGKPAKAGDKNVIVEAFRNDDKFDENETVIGQDVSTKQENMPDVGGFY